jgi:hypothetical protein
MVPGAKHPTAGDRAKPDSQNKPRRQSGCRQAWFQGGALSLQIACGWEPNLCLTTIRPITLNTSAAHRSLCVATSHIYSTSSRASRAFEAQTVHSPSHPDPLNPPRQPTTDRRTNHSPIALRCPPVASRNYKHVPRQSQARRRRRSPLPRRAAQPLATSAALAPIHAPHLAHRRAYNPRIAASLGLIHCRSSAATHAHPRAAACACLR